MGTITKRWQTVDSVYHAANEKDLTTANRSEVLALKDGKTGGTRHSYPLSMFMCQLYHRVNGTVHNPDDRQGRPNISPFAKGQIVLPATGVLEDPEDFLLPLQPYDDPTVDPDEWFRSRGGRKHVEMVLIRSEDIENADLELSELSVLQHWKLGDHPFVRLDDDGNVNYRIIHDVWWLLLTPYEVPLIPGIARWEPNRFTPSQYNPTGQMGPREVANPLTKKLVENLLAFQQLLESSKEI